MNLLQETLKKLEQNGKSPSDVLWVGSLDGLHAMPWGDFEKVARFDYDSGFGSQEIASDLVIVGHDWWMTRGEYGGSEWWDFQTIPIRSVAYSPFHAVSTGDSWASIADMNSREVSC